jgi:hypothetical protein
VVGMSLAAIMLYLFMHFLCFYYLGNVLFDVLYVYGSIAYVSLDQSA